MQNPLMYGGGGEKAGGGVAVGVLCEQVTQRWFRAVRMLVVVEAGRWRRLHAKDRMAAADKWAAHREIQAWRAAGRRRMEMD